MDGTSITTPVNNANIELSAQGNGKVVLDSSVKAGGLLVVDDTISASDVNTDGNIVLTPDTGKKVVAQGSQEGPLRNKRVPS